MNILLELDRLLPLCNSNVEVADQLMVLVKYLLSEQKISTEDKLVKLADTMKHCNKHLQAKLIFILKEFQLSEQSIYIPGSVAVVKRFLLIWESDDAYGRALACMFYAVMRDYVGDTVEIWYRVWQSTQSEIEVERVAGKECATRFREIVKSTEFEEMFHECFK